MINVTQNFLPLSHYPGDHVATPVECPGLEVPGLASSFLQGHDASLTRNPDTVKKPGSFGYEGDLGQILMNGDG